MCVGDLATLAGVTVSAASQHIAKLRAYRLVTFRREAQTIFYSATDHPFVAKVLGMVE